MNQIDQLEKALKDGSAHILAAKWKADVFAREMNKGDSVSFTLTSLRGDVTKSVLGKCVEEHFAFHKDAFGGKFFVLSHIETGIAIFSGKKPDVLKAIEKFKVWENRAVLTKAVENKKLQALAGMDENVVQEYRVLYELARGRDFT